MRRILILILLFTSVTFVLSEIALRIFFYEQLKTQHYPLIYKIDTLLGYIHIPNCSSRICIPSIDKDFTLNNHGFYGPDFSNNKLEKVFRIAVVGNSITEGLWLNAQKNYPLILQDIFYQNGYKLIEVLNCAFGGINKDIRNYMLIKENVIKYNPDIILFSIDPPFFNENEYRENYKNYMLRHNGTKQSRQKAINQVESIKSKFLFTALYDISYIFRAYCKNFYNNNNCPLSEVIRTYREKTSSAPDIIPFQYSFATSLDLLIELNDTLAINNIKLIVFTFTKYGEIGKLFDQNNIDYISLDIPFENSMFHKHDGHPNKKGQNMIARYLYNKLQEDNYLNDVILYSE